MTITEIAVDLIRERDQLRKRIRELEQELAEWQGALEEIDRFLSTVPGTKQGALRIEQLQSFFERIARAREILSHPVCQTDFTGQMKRALDALEGK